MNAPTSGRSEEGLIEGDDGKESDVAPIMEWPTQMEVAQLKESHTDFTMTGRIFHVSSVHKNDAMKNKFVGSQCIHTREQPWYPHLWAAEVLNRWPAKAPTCINLRYYLFKRVYQLKPF